MNRGRHFGDTKRTTACNEVSRNRSPLVHTLLLSLSAAGRWWFRSHESWRPRTDILTSTLDGLSRFCLPAYSQFTVPLALPLGVSQWIETIWGHTHAPV